MHSIFLHAPMPPRPLNVAQSFAHAAVSGLAFGAPAASLCLPPEPAAGAADTWGRHSWAAGRGRRRETGLLGRRTSSIRARTASRSACALCRARSRASRFSRLLCSPTRRISAAACACASANASTRPRRRRSCRSRHSLFSLAARRRTSSPYSGRGRAASRRGIWGGTTLRTASGWRPNVRSPPPRRDAPRRTGLPERLRIIRGGYGTGRPFPGASRGPPPT